MSKIGTNYTCAMCKGVFQRAQSDEDALAEAQDTFPGATVEESEIVCEDCYQKIKPDVPLTELNMLYLRLREAMDGEA